MITTQDLWESAPSQDWTHAEYDARARVDVMTFRLHQQFVQAHGAPKGELTTLVTNLAEGGVFVSNGKRQ